MVSCMQYCSPCRRTFCRAPGDLTHLVLPLVRGMRPLPPRRGSAFVQIPLYTAHSGSPSGTAMRLAYSAVMNDEVITKMRARVEQCRRLARTTNDAHVAQVLRQMADEGEADIAKLEMEQQNRTV